MPAPRLPIAEYVELRHLNTFHVGATARYHARVATLDELRQVLAWIKARALPFLILGQGSNILFRQDYPGVIVELHLRGIEVLRELERKEDDDGQDVQEELDILKMLVEQDLLAQGKQPY